MQTTWVLTADSSRARIFEELDEEHHLLEIRDFTNPGGHANQSDLLADEPERRNFPKGGHGGIHDGQPAVDPIEHENQKFSKAIGEYLEHAYNDHLYDRLCVIAAPKFLGLLRQNMSKETQQLVDEEIDKDISWFEKSEIENFMRNLDH